MADGLPVEKRAEAPAAVEQPRSTPRRWTKLGAVPRRAGSGVAAEWREGHLRLADLDIRARALAALALLLLALACLTVVWVGAGWSLPGGTVAVPGSMLAEPAPVEIPLVAPVLVCLGLAVGAALLVESALRSRRPSPRLVLAGIGLVGAALAAMTLQGVGQYDAFAQIGGAPDAIYSTLPRATGVAALACAIAIAVLPLGWARRFPTLTLALAAAPFALPLLPLALNVTRSLPVSPVAEALYPQFPATISGVAWVAGPIHSFATIVAFALIPLGLWQAVTWARASARQVGLNVGVAVERWPPLVVGIGAAKLGWLVLGWTGLLPLALGGASPAWSALREDGPVAWFYGIGLLVVGAAALPYLGRRPISDRRAERAARWTVALFWSFFAAAVLLIVLLPLAQLVTPDDAAVNDLAGSAFAFVLERATFVGAVVTVAALAVGLAWLARGQRTSAAVFLVVLGAWTLPRAVGVIADEAPPELAALSGLPVIDAPTLPLIDLLVTVAVLLVALGGATRKLPAVDPPVLVLALVVSTLLAHGGALTPVGAGVLFFALALVFPVAYELSFDSEGLNRLHRERAAAVLRALGIRAAVLALVAVAVSVDLAALFGSGRDEFAKVLFALPLSVIIVVVAGQSMLRRPARAQAAAVPETTASAPEATAAAPEATAPAPEATAVPVAVRAVRAHHPTPRAALVAVVAGLLMVAVPALALRPLDPAFAGLYPSDADHFAAFAAERQRFSLGLETIAPDTPRAGDEVLAQAALAADWLAERSPPACLGRAWEAQQTVVGKVRELGLLLRAFDHLLAGTAQATAEELAEIGRRLEVVGGEMQQAGAHADAAAAAAEEACSVR